VATSFDGNIFINCPFDEEFSKLLKPIIFTILYANLNPRIALEMQDSASDRLEHIFTLIEESRYAIHDLSRLEFKSPQELPRMNMPFELGIDFGARKFGNKKLKKKKCLVIEAQPYRYKAAISDLSGRDINHHGNDPLKAVQIVRDWVCANCNRNLPAPSKVWNSYIDFSAALYEDLQHRLGYSEKEIDEIKVPELMQHMQIWIAELEAS